MEWLHHGQKLEAQGRLTDAVVAYDRAITLTAAEKDLRPETQRTHAIAWMNLGNALQRFEDAEHVAAAVRAYDEAIGGLGALPHDTDWSLRNSLGAAWMNRGRARQLARDMQSLQDAIASHEQAITNLRTLPLEAAPIFRLNLAGAWLNLADAKLGNNDAAGAAASARAALELTAGHEQAQLEFADVGLKARRAYIDALGHQLYENGQTSAVAFPVVENAALAAEASDAIDDAMALARHWETRVGALFRPLALRIFRFGTQLYRVHQPQFLGEFILENLDDSSRGSFSAAAEFLAVAREALVLARADLERPRHFQIGDPESEKLLLLSRELAVTEQRIAQPGQKPAPG